MYSRNSNRTQGQPLVNFDNEFILMNFSNDNNNGHINYHYHLSPNSPTKNKHLNYIQELLLQNYEDQCHRNYCHPENFVKLFDDPFLSKIPKSIDNEQINTSEKNLPLSIFYHTSKKWILPL